MSKINTAEKIAARIGVITKTRRVSGCPHTEITTGETGRPAQAGRQARQPSGPAIGRIFSP
jgi:hypothetical protein